MVAIVQTSRSNIATTSKRMHSWLYIASLQIFIVLIIVVIDKLSSETRNLSFVPHNNAETLKVVTPAGAGTAADHIYSPLSLWSINRLVEWLHIPKTGTSFGNVLVRWACPWQDVDIPVTKYKTVMDSKCSHLFRIDPRVKPNLLIADHVSLHGRTTSELQNVFTMLRSPKTRLASGYHFKTHYKKLNATEADICQYITQNGQANKSPFLAKGSQVKMIVGKYMETPKYIFESFQEPTVEETELACSNLHLFAFLGVSDYWDATVCLFHKMYGGAVLESDTVHLRQGDYAADPASASSVDCVDRADETLFACAMHIFVSRLRPHPECLKLLTYKDFGNPVVDAILQAVM